MPNWCQNNLTISGQTDELKDWLSANSFSFAAMLPLEDENESTANFAWGTKWEIPVDVQPEIVDALMDDDEAFFVTAWTPPIGALQRLSSLFPGASLRLEYFEAGNAFAGYAVLEGGTMVKSAEYNGMGQKEEWDAYYSIGSEVFNHHFDEMPHSNQVVGIPAILWNKIREFFADGFYATPPGITTGATLAEQVLGTRDSVDLSEGAEARRQQIIDIASDLPYLNEGEVEIDDDAMLSESSDNGCYVSAWVWCPFDGTPFDEEQEPEPTEEDE